MIIQRYVFRELVLHFLFTLVVVTGIFVVALGVQTLYHYSELPLLVVVRSFPYFVPYSFTYTMPMALLVAVVLTYSRLSGDGEILALRTAGVHLYPIVSPAIALALILSLGSFWVNDRLIPFANVKKRAIGQFAVEQVVMDVGSGKSTALGLPGVNLTWERVLPDGTLVNPVLVLAHPDAGEPPKILADTARVRLVHGPDGSALRIEFGGLRTLAEMASDTSTYHLPAQIGSTTYEFPLDELFESPKKVDDRPIAELIHLSRLRQYGKLKNKSAVASYREIHRRLAFSGAFLAFVLVGAPLGILFRRAGKMAALLASFLVVMVGYYPLFMLGQALCESERLPPAIGYWIADLVVSLVGLVLLVRVFRQ